MWIIAGMLGALSLQLLLLARPEPLQVPKFNDSGSRIIEALTKMDSLLNSRTGRLKLYPWTSGSGGFVSGRQARWTRSFNLKAGVPFSMVFAGDKSVRTIYCKVNNNATKKVEQQASGEADNFTFTYTPTVSGSYQIECGAPGEVRTPCFLMAAYLKSDGVLVDSASLGAMTASLATTATVATSGNPRLRFPMNYAAIQFGQLGAGKFFNYGQVNYAPSAVFAGSDSGRGGMVLSVYGADGLTIGEDRSSDAIAGVPLEKGVSRGTVRLTNTSKGTRMGYFLVVIA